MAHKTKMNTMKMKKITKENAAQNKIIDLLIETGTSRHEAIETVVLMSNRERFAYLKKSGFWFDFDHEWLGWQKIQK